jgi:epoxyqueuosine reductase
MATTSLDAAVRARARRLGFTLVGIAAPDASEHMDFYRSWLADGRHGTMAYLSREDAVARRADLSRTMPDAASGIMVAEEYFQHDPPGVPDDPSRAVIARYARGEDYHEVVKAKLESLLAWLNGEVEGGVRGRAYVDTGPILERELARRAGLGWFGKNTMLINPGRGSYFFVGLLLVDVALTADDPFVEDRCGTCRACLDACPTGALLGRGEDGAPVIDARRCISYLTIELRDEIPLELRRPMGNRVFGCDICQEVCPWNERFAVPTEQESYRARGDLNPLLTALAAFGIIGVGASELITYPYWCLEKGYAKFTGKRSDDDAWANRARGWMRVMHVDAFLSMIVYTVATLAFFLMGVAVLYNEGRDPDGMRMVSTLATAYVPVFGEYARWLFMIGAVAVLYSTFLVATAGNARMWTDGLKIYGFMDHNNEKSHDRGITFFSLLIPVLCLVSFWGGVNPVSAVLVAGFMQATMLPMIGFGALYLRHTRTDPRLKPSKAWDAALIISCIGLLMAGVWGAVQQIQKALG